MPKQKTKKSVVKRVRVTKTGKLKRARAFKKHLMGSKNAKRRRRLRREAFVSKGDEKKVKRLLGLQG